MQHRTASPAPIHPTPAFRRARAAGLLAAGLSVVALAGCGSSGDDGAKEKPAELCTAVERYADAIRAGDRTEGADALASAVDGLPEDDRRYVESYVLALRGAPASFPRPDEDGVSYSRTQASFDEYVTEACGKDVLPGETTTTVATGSGDAPADGGAGGSTGVQGADDQTEGGSGSGSGSSSGSGGSGSGSSSGGSGGSMTDSDSGTGGTGTGSGSGTDDGGSQSGDTTGATGSGG